MVSAGMSGTTTGDTFTGSLTITFRNGGPQSVYPVLGFALPAGAQLTKVPSGCQRDDDAGSATRTARPARSTSARIR